MLRASYSKTLQPQTKINTLQTLHSQRILQQSTTSLCLFDNYSSKLLQQLDNYMLRASSSKTLQPQTTITSLQTLHT